MQLIFDMEKDELHKLLLSSAFHAMACDGEIHQKELKEIYELGESSDFFKGLNLDSELQDLADELQRSTRDSFRSYFQKLREAEIELVEQCLIVECVLRIIRADGGIDPNEKLFLRTIVRNMGLIPEMLQERFSGINELLGTDFAQKTKAAESPSDTFEMPSADDFKQFRAHPLDEKSEATSEDHEDQ